MKAAILGVLALGLAGCNSGGSGAGTPAAGAGLGSLIAVNLSDIRAEIAKNVDLNLDDVPITIQLPVTVAANVCGVNVNLLSAQVNGAGQTCNATATSPELEQTVRNTVGS
jgi:hypothetical protein